MFIGPSECLVWQQQQQEENTHKKNDKKNLSLDITRKPFKQFFSHLQLLQAHGPLPY